MVGQNTYQLCEPFLRLIEPHPIERKKSTTTTTKYSDDVVLCRNNPVIQIHGEVWFYRTR